jgi:hypothetical protein
MVALQVFLVLVEALVVLGLMVVVDVHVDVAAFHLQVSLAVVDYPIQAVVVEPLEALMVQELLLNLVVVAVVVR